MEFRDTVLKRRMVRNFADKPVDPAIIDRILELTRHAPSAGFTQGQSFIVVTRPELKKSACSYVRGRGTRPKRVCSFYFQSACPAHPLHK